MLILAAQNLNNFRFQTNILSAMRVVCVKCSEDNFQVASFKPEQVVNKEAKDAIQAGLEKMKYYRTRQTIILVYTL